MLSIINLQFSFSWKLTRFQLSTHLVSKLRLCCKSTVSVKQSCKLKVVYWKLVVNFCPTIFSWLKVIFIWLQVVSIRAPVMTISCYGAFCRPRYCYNYSFQSTKSLEFYEIKFPLTIFIGLKVELLNVVSCQLSPHVI